MGAVPDLVRCCRCKKAFPPNAVIVSGGEKKPMFVVLDDVTSVERAIALSTCQACLHKAEIYAPPERGLEIVLKSLGVAMLKPVARVGHAASGPKLAAAKPASIAARARPALAATIEERIGKTATESLWGALQTRHAGLLTTARELLATMRAMAQERDIEEGVEELDKTIAAIVKMDPRQRHRLAILQELGTTEAELEELRRLYWLTHTVGPKKGYGGNSGGSAGEVSDRESVRLRGALETIKLTPHTSLVRKRTRLPPPNPQLGEPLDLPKVVYPFRKKYGKEYTVKGGQRSGVVPVLVNTCTLEALVSWAGDHPELEIRGTCPARLEARSINLSDLLCWHFETSVMESHEDVIDSDPTAAPTDADVITH